MEAACLAGEAVALELNAVASRAYSRASATARRLREIKVPVSPLPILEQVSSVDVLIRRHRERLLAAARRNGVRKVRIFGSAARGEDSPDSDVDLLVELEPERILLDLIAFQQDAGDILGVHVDAATPEILKDRVRERVLAEVVPL